MPVLVWYASCPTGAATLPTLCTSSAKGFQSCQDRSPPRCNFVDGLILCPSRRERKHSNLLAAGYLSNGLFRWTPLLFAPNNVQLSSRGKYHSTVKAYGKYNESSWVLLCLDARLPRLIFTTGRVPKTRPGAPSHAIYHLLYSQSKPPGGLACCPPF
jgi:hypothetical protein